VRLVEGGAVTARIVGDASARSDTVDGIERPPKVRPLSRSETRLEVESVCGLAAHVA
jgi:hypothetical protein